MDYRKCCICGRRANYKSVHPSGIYVCSNNECHLHVRWNHPVIEFVVASFDREPEPEEKPWWKDTSSREPEAEKKPWWKDI